MIRCVSYVRVGSVMLCGVMQCHGVLRCVMECYVVMLWFVVVVLRYGVNML